MVYIHNVMGSVDLQKTLASASAMPDPTPRPHHPIVCGGHLWLYEDGRFACEHAEVDEGDKRTRHCIDNSIAFLLFEELARREGVGRAEK